MQRQIKNKIPISISIPLQTLAEMDDYCFQKNQSRSEFVLESIKEKLQKINEK